MMLQFPLLSIITFLPLVGAIFIALFIRIEDGSALIARNAKQVSLWVTVATFFLSLLLFIHFDPNDPGFQFEENLEWIKGSGIGYHLGIDGISLFFILLTTFLMPLCVLASWNSIKSQVREYMIAFLILESLVIGVFASLDFMVFYFFFEGSLIPMFLIIGIWGGENRVYAALKFFLYTLLGSVLLLLALLYIYIQFGTTDIPVLMEKTPGLAKNIQIWLWLAFFASFAVKVPMWPFHTWLPDAHVQAPTAGSMILAGVLLKLGAYGFLRFSLPMLPDASVDLAPFVFVVSIIAVIYTSFVALMQKDMKKLIAYSSIAHMGYVTVGIFVFNTHGVQGAIFQMLSHGVVSAALFLGVGALYDRVHTKEIARYGGIVHKMPVFAMMFMVYSMASVGLPGTSGFVGEFLVMLGAFESNTIVASLTATGIILGAIYMLWLYKRVIFGRLVNKELEKITDLDSREKFMFAILGIVIVLMGIYPGFILDPIKLSVSNLIQGVL